MKTQKLSLVGLILLLLNTTLSSAVPYEKLIIPYVNGTALQPYKRLIQEKAVGGIILMGTYSAETAEAITGQLHDWASEVDRPPLIIGIDQEGGRVARLKHNFPSYPSAKQMAGQPSGETYEQGLLTGKALQELGITMVFAPVLDVRTHPNDTVIGDRSYGSEPKTVGQYGLSLFFGLHQSGVTAVAKHFPGHGGVELDSHKALPHDNNKKSTLFQTHIPPFAEFIAHNGPAIMVSHVLYTNIDPTLPASLSPTIMSDLLRKKLHFKGLIITDDIAMGALKDYGTLKERALRAIEAGADYVITSKIPN